MRKGGFTLLVSEMMRSLDLERKLQKLDMFDILLFTELRSISKREAGHGRGRQLAQPQATSTMYPGTQACDVRV